MASGKKNRAKISLFSIYSDPKNPKIEMGRKFYYFSSWWLGNFKILNVISVLRDPENSKGKEEKYRQFKI